MGKTHEVAVSLRRDSPTEQWGFSLVGGADVQTPLIVTRVGFGSPSDGVLQRGDIITKVGNYDARDIRHQDAQTLFKNAGNNIRVVVQRWVTNRSIGFYYFSRIEKAQIPIDPAPMAVANYFDCLLHFLCRLWAGSDDLFIILDVLSIRAKNKFYSLPSEF
jgi:hypothetical protein